MDYAGIVATIRRLALEAGAAILEVYGSDDFAVRAKSDASPVTEADELRRRASSPAASRAAFPGDPGGHRGAGRRATASAARRSSSSSTRSTAPRSSCSAAATSPSTSR